MQIEKGFLDISPYEIKFADEVPTSENPFRNPRSTLNAEEIKNKKESIKQHGLLKPPIVRVLHKNEDGFKYEMVAGSLRLRCILKLLEEKADCYNPKTAKWENAEIVYNKMTCKVIECDDDVAIKISISENLDHSQVSDLDLMEYCQELENLKNPDGTKKYTRKEIANFCNRSESWVSLTLQLDQLDNKYKDLMRIGKLTRTGAITLMLGTKKEKFDDVIKMCENEAKKEADHEIQEAENEIQEAENEIHKAILSVDINKPDENIFQQAQARAFLNKKKLDTAKDKKSKAQKKIKELVITDSAVKKALSNLKEGEKKGKPKPLTLKRVKEIREEYTEEDKTENELFNKTYEYVIDMILGKNPIIKPKEILSRIIKDEQGEESDF
jgi:ParB-like chromosome segregation protein Spo0J